MDYSDEELDKEWSRVKQRFLDLTNKKPNLNTILFLIGVNELGKGKKKFSKEQKQDLMHIAICKMLSFSGYYELEGYDQDGWPHWKNIKALPKFDILEQEKFLKAHIIRYFAEVEDEDRNL